MATETRSLLERKYEKRFDLLDVDGLGVVDQNSFAALSERLIGGLGVTSDSPRAQRVRDGYQQMWSSLQQLVDENGDGAITRAEFVDGMGRLAGDPAGFRAVIEPLARLNLSLCDADGDGNLNAEEFVNLLRLFNADTEQAGAMFQKLDTSGDGFLSLDEIIGALSEFYLSTDPESPGNQLFGSV